MAAIFLFHFVSKMHPYFTNFLIPNLYLVQLFFFFHTNCRWLYTKNGHRANSYRRWFFNRPILPKIVPKSTNFLINIPLSATFYLFSQLIDQIGRPIYGTILLSQRIFHPKWYQILRTFFLFLLIFLRLLNSTQIYELFCIFLNLYYSDQMSCPVNHSLCDYFCRRHLILIWRSIIPKNDSIRILWYQNLRTFYIFL